MTSFSSLSAPKPKQPSIFRRLGIFFGLAIPATCIAAVFFYYAVSMMRGETANIIPTNINFGSWWQALIITAYAIAINTSTSFLGYLYANNKRFRAVAWIDNRLLPTIITRKDEKQVIPVPKTQPIRPFTPGDPDLKHAPPMATQIKYGTIKLDFGEDILGIFFPGWHPRTQWPSFWERLFTITIISTLLVLILLLFTPTATLIIATLGLVVLSQAYVSIFRYWGKEWLRYGEFFIITTARYGHTFAKFSWLGFVRKSGIDIDIQWNPISEAVNVDQSTTGKDWRTVGWFYESFGLEKWAKGPSQLGSINIRNVSERTAELLFDYNFASYIVLTLNSAITKRVSTVQELSAIMNEKKKYIRATPKDDTADRAQRISDADKWALNEIEALNITPPSMVNIFDLRRAKLQQIATDKPESSPPSQSSASDAGTIPVEDRFPGRTRRSESESTGNDPNPTLQQSNSAKSATADNNPGITSNNPNQHSLPSL